MRIKPESDAKGVKIKVVGVGGAGGNAVSRMFERLTAVDLIAINTDSQALEANRAGIKLQIGERLTRGRGAGSNPETGKYAAEEDRARIAEALKGADVVFLTLGLGGGTGTGAAPVVAKIARDSGALVIAFVTMPFEHQGAWRMELAEKGLEVLRHFIDTLIVIHNQKIFEVIQEDTPLDEAYGMIDEILYQGVSAISDLITQPGLENLDFADLRCIVEESGDGLIGAGVAEGPGRAEAAAQAAISNPFLERKELVSARNVLISIAARRPGVMEVNKVVQTITQILTPDANKIFCGSVIDERLEDKFKVTVIATSLETRGRAATGNAAVTPVAAAVKEGGKPAAKKEEYGDLGMFNNPDKDWSRPAVEESSEN